MEQLKDTAFYLLEKSIKSYRQYAQRRLTENNFDITIDQWLVLKTIDENPDQTQHQVADTIFKDYASLTRIIELLVNKGYLDRVIHPEDKRRFKITLSPKGNELMNAVLPIVKDYRSIALTGITQKQLAELQQTLNTIINNCPDK